MQKKYKEFNIYWNKELNVPVILSEIDDEKRIKNLKYISTDLRPVFIEEKHLLLNLYPNEFTEEIYTSSVWATKSNRHIVVDGISKELKINATVKKIKDKDEFRKKVLDLNIKDEWILKEKEIFKNFSKANKEHFDYLTKSEEKDQDGYPIGAYPFVRKVTKEYEGRLLLSSFSGGKDSTVTSHLVRKALNNNSILHIFGDTTLELPLTYDYVERFKENNPLTPFLDERNEENNFFDMCKEIGPPSRVKSWCCSIFKTGPMGTTLANFDTNMLTFLGMRRSESSSRSKYKRVAQSPKILKQIAACPMIDWLDIDVWLYMLSEELDYNYSYRQGFSRVGCWVCPHNSDWSAFLSSIYNSEEFKKWYNYLINFAKSIGKLDYEDYINDGKWKARQGGAGLEKSKDILLDSKECINEENSKNYILNNKINNEFYELFKPFGDTKYIKKGKLKELYISNRKTSTVIFKILLKDESNEIKVTIIDFSDRYIFNKIEKQLNKFNSCMYCQACNSACPTGAITVGSGVYKIDESKCINCLKCIDKFDSGCIISSALKIKKGSN